MFRKTAASAPLHRQYAGWGGAPWTHLSPHELAPWPLPPPLTRDQPASVSPSVSHMALALWPGWERQAAPPTEPLGQDPTLWGSSERTQQGLLPPKASATILSGGISGSRSREVRCSPRGPSTCVCRAACALRGPCFPGQSLTRRCFRPEAQTRAAPLTGPSLPSWHNPAQGETEARSECACPGSPG